MCVLFFFNSKGGLSVRNCNGVCTCRYMTRVWCPVTSEERGYRDAMRDFRQMRPGHDSSGVPLVTVPSRILHMLH